VHAPQLKGAAKAGKHPSDDGMNIWEDGDYRMHDGGPHFYQRLGDDPIKDACAAGTFSSGRWARLPTGNHLPNILWQVDAGWRLARGCHGHRSGAHRFERPQGSVRRRGHHTASLASKAVARVLITNG
jgi:hypothetical protein